MADTRVARGDRLARSLLLRVGLELRDGRRAAGLTIRAVAQRVGISASELSRIERAMAPWVALGTLTRVAAVVGLDLWVRTYPGGDPIRDAGHARTTRGFVKLVGPGASVESEVPIGDARDQRAWDLRITDASGRRAGVEIDTRLVDAQAYVRRMTAKLAEGRVDVLILVLADTRANRAAVEAARPTLDGLVAVEDRGVRRGLADGRLPERNVLLFVAPADGMHRARRLAGGRTVGRHTRRTDGT